MATRFYWHGANSSFSNLPTTRQSTQTTSGGASQSVNRTMDTTIGTSQTSISFTASGTTIQYFGRWVSSGIEQSSIAANTWTLTFGYADAAIIDSTLSLAVYIWRPGTSSKVATIFDSTISFTSVNSTERGHKVTFSGSAVSGIQHSDVLCCEFMCLSGSPVTKTLYFDGTTVITTNGTATSSAASYIETPENLTLGTATRFYLHAASTTVTGTFPSTEQSSSLAATAQFDAYTVNRDMDTTIGTSQFDLTAAKTNSSATARMYMTRFVSDTLAAQTINANTWTLNFAAWADSSLPTYPASSSGASAFVPLSVYVWRPSTGALIGSIFDGLSTTTTTSISQTTEKSVKVTFNGSALSTVQDGDVLIYEAWTATNSTVSRTFHYAFDGTTVNTADNAAVTNHASFIETPENLNFYTPPATIDCTVTSKVVTNKIITKN